MEIIVYTIPTCSHCRTLKDFLKSNNLMFKEVNVLENEAAADDLIARSGQTNVPVTEIDGKLIIGLDLKSLKTALKLR